MSLEGNPLPDKRLYSYKQALSQPYWIQKLNDEFSFNSPIRLSRVMYGLAIGGLMWFFLESVAAFLPKGLRLVVSGYLALIGSAFFSELIVDGKYIVFYLKDYLLYYLKYGIRAETIYINKGQVYRKPQSKKGVK